MGITLVLFWTIAAYFAQKALPLQCMNSIKYHYWHIERHSIAGNTNLDGCLGKSVDPNGLTLLLCTDGYAEASINFEQKTIRKGSLVILSYDLTFIPISTSEDFNALYVSFTTEMTMSLYIKLNSSAFWGYTYEHPVFQTGGEEYDALVMWFKQTTWILSRYNSTKNEDMLQNNLYNLFMSVFLEQEQMLDNEAFNRQNRKRGADLVSQFYMLVNRYYTRHREVAFYAEKLNITTDYLHKLISEADSLSPKEWINYNLIAAIKVYLTNTSLSIKNIASELNFEDVSYMCRFFRKRVGVPPLEYRNSNKHDK